MSYGICLKCQLLKFYQGPNLPEWDLPPGSAAQSRSVFQRWLPGTGESALCSQSCQLQTLLISRCTGSGAAASSGCSSCRRWQRCVAAAHRSSCPGRAWSAQQCRWAGSGTGWLPPRKKQNKKYPAEWSKTLLQKASFNWSKHKFESHWRNKNVSV